jgi:di/tricarboxylate transporter
VTFEIGLLLALTAASVVFFSIDKVPPDVVALSLVLALVFTGLLPADEAFRGFGSDTVILILGLLITTGALARTGVVEIVGAALLRWTGSRPMRLLIVVMVATAVLSSFMSNTAATAFFVPIVIGLAHKANVSPRQLLLPLAFASILTSSVTLISTSTNIVVSGMLPRYGLKPLGMFELAPVGVPIAVVGLLYMVVAGRIWLRSSQGDQAASRDRLREYLSEIVILPGSELVGKTLADSRLGEELDLTVVRVVRGKSNYLSPRGDLVLQAEDVLLVEVAPEDLLKVKDKAGIEIKADLKLGDPFLPNNELGLVEAIILARSPLLGRTLKGLGLRERYGIQVLGISRHGEILHRKISLLPLRTGDILLVQGPKTNIAALVDERAFRVIETLDHARPKRKRAPLAIAIFLISLALGTFKVMPFHIAAMLGAVAVFVTRCITPEEAYREVEWKVVILIGSMLALGVAMDRSGAAKYLASLLVSVSSGYGPRFLLAGFFALTVALTQPMSNQAAAVVIIPVAIQAALQLNIDPRPYAVTVAVAASCSYLTPLEPSCLMVYGPGGYKFTDFLKIGSVLTLLIAGLAVWLIPLFWRF